MKIIHIEFQFQFQFSFESTRALTLSIKFSGCPINLNKKNYRFTNAFLKLHACKVDIHMHMRTHTNEPKYHQTFNLPILFITITYTKSNLQLLQNSNNAPKTAHMKVHNFFNQLNAFKRIKSGCEYSLVPNCFEYVRIASSRSRYKQNE